MRYIFGPVKSRRFGVSVGIDLSPKIKSCNFDCLYCELEKGKKTDYIQNEPSPKEIIQELKEFFSKNPYPDVITITANGEPTLYTKLDTLIDLLNSIKKSSKTLILSNASTIPNPKIRKTLSKLDMVKLSVDAVSDTIFKKVDRPLKNISITQIISGIKSFRKIFNGELIIEVLIVKNINDDIEEIKNIAQILREIKPDRVDIGTIDRPPAYNVDAVSSQKLEELAEYFYGLNVFVIKRKQSNLKKFSLDEKDLLKTLKLRPLPKEDILELFDIGTINKLKDLKKRGLLKEKKIGNIVFMCVN
ncbi:MAG: radical SAM protein [Aquificae bacterium]|nr:radical SAM protein [Aquificota bacterium]